MERTLWTALLVFAASTIFGAGVASAQTEAKVAIMPTQDDTGEFDRETLEAATGYLRTKFAESGDYLVIDKSRQAEKRREVVKNLKRESYKECYDESCQIEVGKALMADRALSATIGKLGDVCLLRAEMIDLAKEASIDGASAEFDCTSSGLREAVSTIAEDFGAGDSARREPREPGYLSVETADPGIAVMVDGESVGQTPVEKKELPPGTHEVALRSDCRENASRPVDIARGEEQTVSAELADRRAEIDVRARTSESESVDAGVQVDGSVVGRAPGAFEVSACAERVEVMREGYETYEESLSDLQPSGTRRVRAELSRKTRTEAGMPEPERVGPITGGQVEQRGRPSVGPIVLPLVVGGGSLFSYGSVQVGSSLGWGFALSNRTTLEIEGEFAGYISLNTESAVESEILCGERGPNDSGGGTDDEFGTTDTTDGGSVGCSALSSGWHAIPQARLHWFASQHAGIDFIAGAGYGSGYVYELGETRKGPLVQVGVGMSLVESIFSFELVYNRLMVADSPGHNVGLRMRFNWVGAIAEAVERFM